MNHDTTPCALPALTSDFLRSSDCLVDNVFADLWKKVGMAVLLQRCGFQKRSGVPVNDVVYCLMLWKSIQSVCFRGNRWVRFALGARTSCMRR